MSSPNPFALKQVPPLLNQSNALITLEASFLDLKSQAELNKTCRTVTRVISPQLRQSRAEKLLDHVLNIDEKRKKEILAMLQCPDRGPLSFMLMPANGQVKYRSSKRGNQIVPRGAAYKNVSPLEAAASCGDFYLVKLFEGALSKKQKHRAGLQLQAVLADSNFLSAFKRLQTRYHIYMRFFEQIDGVTPDWKTNTMLWEQVADAQKNLSNFGLNILCDPVRRHPYLPDYFTREPKRAMQFMEYTRAGDKKLDLSLDSIGRGTASGLRNDNGRCELYSGGSWGSCSFILDSQVLDGLVRTVIPTELGNITKRLLSYPDPSEHSGARQDSSKSRCVVS